jgi:inositol-phosphate transport system substrate-binding protein
MNYTRVLASTVIAVATFAGASLQTTAASAEEITLKMWARADRSGPLRAGNIVAAAETLNGMLKAAGSPNTVVVDVFESPATGFDADALDLLRAFSVGQGPDVYVAAHEWVGEFANSGYAMDMEAFVQANPWAFDDIIPILWESTKVGGKIYAIPQDSEIRMFFYSKDMLRELGKDEDFIESLPALVDKGEFTIWDMSELAKELVDAGIAEVGIIHRPNTGPDFQMTMAVFGFTPYNAEEAKLQASRSALERFYEWIQWNADNGVTPRNNTAMSWDTVHELLPTGKAFIKHHGIWDVPNQIRIGGWDGSEEDYVRRVGWTHVPAAELGGQPANLSHPIVYVVNPNSPHPDLAALLVAIATQPHFNTEHAVTTAHTAVTWGQLGQPAYQEAWALRRATPLLERSVFMPNHAQIGPFNNIIYTGIQGVETGRLTAKEAADFVIEEMELELGDDVIILD